MRTDLCGARAGGRPELFAAIKRVLHAEAQRSPHAADLLLGDGVRHGSDEAAQHHVN